MLHSGDHLEAIANVLRKPQFRHILVISDEIYEQLVYQDVQPDGQVTARRHVCFATLPGMYERTLVVNGFSKSHAMPGLRIGYLAAPKYFVQVATKIQGQFTSCASSIGQIAAARAMQLEFDAPANAPRITHTLAIMDEKRTYVLQRLRAIPDVRFAHPTAAFYVFLDLARYFEHGAVTPQGDEIRDADRFCEYLLRSFCTALVPGSAFGEVHGCRISYAASMDVLEHSLDGLENALKSLRR